MIITTILNIIELTKPDPIIRWIVVGCLISVAVFFITGLCCAGRGNIGNKISSWCIFVVIISFFGAVICSSISDNFTVPNGEYQYEILIDDSATFSEINEKYDIIEQRGEIFVVKEKE